MTDEPKAVKKKREETGFIKNKEKPLKPVKKDTAVVVWNSRRNYNKDTKRKADFVNDPYLNRCQKISDIIMTIFISICFFGFVVLSYYYNSAK